MMTRYYLRHKNIDTAAFDIDEDGDFNHLVILNEEELPILGEGMRKNIPWWIRERAIPLDRPDLRDILRRAGYDTPQEYLIANLALGLTDLYWLCPDSAQDLKWEQVNLYDHPTGAVTFRAGLNGISTPIQANSSQGGSLEKYAQYREDGWHMIKKGNGRSPFGLQNINEAFASYVHQKQGFAEYVDYTLHRDIHGVCESCECKYFTDAQHELISAYNVTGGLNVRHQSEADACDEFTKACIRNGLDREYVEHFMDYMLLTDFLMTNVDRHWENFGILRDPDSLKFLSMAPIFDTGSSMMFDDSYVHTRTQLLRIEVRGVMRHQADNLLIVKDKKALDVDRLPSRAEVRDFYIRRGVSEEKAEQIAECFELKVDMILEFQHGYPITLHQEYAYGSEPPYRDRQPNPEYSRHG